MLIVSILPRNEWGKQDSLVNENIRAQNGVLRRSLKDIPDWEYVDVFDLFLDKGLQIREDLFKDGLHPNDEGYEILSRQIQRAL
jgi:lysophospholipase L1-like esterase